jgi:hypothetical protein
MALHSELMSVTLLWLVHMKYTSGVRLAGYKPLQSVDYFVLPTIY